MKCWDTCVTRVNEVCDQASETITQWNTDIEKLIVQSGRTAGDIAHRLEIQATLDCMRSIGCTSYRYICENSITSCSVCEELDGQVFDIDDAKEGENLPPMHPNCRCTISITPETVAQWGRYLDLLAESYTSSPWTGDIFIDTVSHTVDYTATLLGGGWNAAVWDDLMRYHGSTTTTTINGMEYRINYETFDNGEIVDQDALGNINYGYFGRHCNIPELVLVSAGGFGQIKDGTVDWSEVTTFFDDPRDAYRVKQGIELYRFWH